MTGATVCWHHGGAAPQVRRKAEERIAAAADPAAAKLVELMSSRKVPYSVQLAAAKDLLDRAGIGTKERAITVELKKWEQDIDGLVIDLPADSYDDVVDAAVVEPEALPSPPSFPHDNVHPLRGPAGGSSPGFGG